MRRNAIQLLQLVAPDNLQYSPLPINSLLDVTYRRSQYELSQRLADQNPDLVCDITTEMVRRLDMCDARGQKQLLAVLVPWLQCLNRNLHDTNYHPNFDLIFEVKAPHACHKANIYDLISCVSCSCHTESAGYNSSVCR